MNFFEHQEIARKHTGRLTLLFGLAVLGIIATTYFAVALFVAFAEGRWPDPATGGVPWDALWEPRLLLLVGGGVTLLVASATGIRLAQLGQGGKVVAELLGGRRVEPDSDDDAERRLLNVVEEMSIASGTPVPAVYVMDYEPGINAFAAGHNPDDAVIGVTRGALDAFTRHELQGVIAHEFSHILNGDMRLNLRLMGILYGILVIGLTGWMVLRSMRFAAYGRGRRDRGGGAMIAAIMALGLVLVVIGSIGTFFGKLIKAAVSRQREFLADASAVQFTRSPDGIADALRRIGGWAAGSQMQDAHANEVSHMLFSSGRGSLRSLLATHPPLEERIRRIDPRAAHGLNVTPAEAAPADQTASRALATQGAAGFAEAAPARRPSAAPDGQAAPQTRLLDQLGQVTDAHLEYAQALIGGLPPALRQAAHDPFAARALIYALLLDPDPEVRQRQRDRLLPRLDAATSETLQTLESALSELKAEARLPLLDMALPALSEPSPRQLAELQESIALLMHTEGAVNVSDFALAHIVRHHLSRHTGRIARGDLYFNLRRQQEPCNVLLSALSYAGHADPATTQRAFHAGASVLEVEGLTLLPREQLDFARFDSALTRLAGLSIRPKRQLLEACARCIAADRRITAAEAELFRAVADSLDCPTPPLLPGQQLA